MNRTLSITTPNDREIVMTRQFAAPRSLVWEAWTRPEYVQRWLGVMPGWTWAECQIDLRVGGTYRYLWANGDHKMGIRGEYLALKPPERIVCTEVFDEAWYQGSGTIELDLVEQAGITTIVQTVRYDSKAIRDGVLESGAMDGVQTGFDILERELATMTG